MHISHALYNQNKMTIGRGWRHSTTCETASSMPAIYQCLVHLHPLATWLLCLETEMTLFKLNRQLYKVAAALYVQVGQLCNNYKRFTFAGIYCYSRILSRSYSKAMFDGPDTLFTLCSMSVSYYRLIYLINLIYEHCGACNTVLGLFLMTLLTPWANLRLINVDQK